MKLTRNVKIYHICGLVALVALATVVFHMIIPALPPSYPQFGLVDCLMSALLITMGPYGAFLNSSMVGSIMNCLVWVIWGAVLISMMAMYFWRPTKTKFVVEILGAVL
jgi:hypothetical protein